MAEEFNITYESLYDILRKEKSQDDLQKLDQNFFRNVLDYLHTKKQILETQQNKESIFASSEIQKTRKQLENTQKILRELYERRENKIIQMALFSSRTNSMSEHEALLEEEKELYISIKNALAGYRENIIGNLINGKLPNLEKAKIIKTSENQTSETKLVRFMTAVPKFVGNDLNVYGPYEEQDIANLPKKVADILIEKSRVELIK